MNNQRHIPSTTASYQIPNGALYRIVGFPRRLIVNGIAFSRTKYKHDYARWAFSRLGEDEEINLMLIYSVYCMIDYPPHEYAFTNKEAREFEKLCEKMIPEKLPVQATFKYPNIAELLREAVKELPCEDANR